MTELTYRQAVRRLGVAAGAAVAIAAFELTLGDGRIAAAFFLAFGVLAFAWARRIGQEGALGGEEPGSR